MKKDEFHAGWDRLVSALHKGKDPIPSQRRNEYAQSLYQVPSDAWEAAIERAARELRFFPTIAELLKFARDHMELTGRVFTTERAWELAVRACANFVPGFRENIEYPNAAIREAVRKIGGPQAIAMCHPRFLDKKRDEFIRFYDNLCMSAEAIGINARGMAHRRYVLQYSAYRTVGGRVEPYGHPFVLDRETGAIVHPRHLELEGEDGARELAEFNAAVRAIGDGGGGIGTAVRQLAPLAGGGPGGGDAGGDSEGASVEPS